MRSRTTDSDHDLPIVPNLYRNVIPAKPDHVWVADFAYIRITTGFCFLAAILDACRRKAVGYAISRRIDTQLALAALNAAVQVGSRRQTLERSRRRPQAGMARGVLAEH